MSNTGCAVILQKKENYMNMYGHILYIIIYLVSPRLLRAYFLVSFFNTCFLKFRNALGNDS